MNGKRIKLVQYPTGIPGQEHLNLEEFDVPEPAADEVRLRTIYLSLDPYMRGRMSPAKSYAAGVALGEVVTAEAVSEVVDSRHDSYCAGDIVLGRSGWQTHSVLHGDSLRKIDPQLAPISTALGVLGMPGFTAYSGLKVHGKPKAGETVVVSAAAGAVGQIVGQLAKIWSCRAVGIAGGPAKCELVTKRFGFDACVDYKAGDFSARLRAECPDGIDVYFENVGGDVLTEVIGLMNDFGRIPVCGVIAYYNQNSTPSGTDNMPFLMRSILTRRLTLRGFINYEHIELFDEFVREVAPRVGDGTISYMEDIIPGFENTIEAFQGLFAGRNTGKLIIQAGDDPTKSAA